MKKKLVKILGLSYSQTQSGSYVVVLSESKGKRKIPIIIKPTEAQQIAIKIEGMKSPRPLTHDLFKSITDAYMVDVQEIFIHTLLEGVFYTKMITSNGLDIIDIECSVGDGIALAMVYKCPIYVSSDVIDTSGILMNDDGSVIKDDSVDLEFDDEKPVKRNIMSIDDMEQLMNDAINNEEYEIAAELRDKIQKMKENIKNNK